MRIGVAGLGVVGGTLYRWLRHHTEYEILGEDPALGFTMLEPVTNPPLDVLFVCVPVPTSADLLYQDLSAVKQVIQAFGKAAHVFIRSSVLPGTCDQLAHEHGKPIFAMPEFLTERIAAVDFEHQNIICGAADGQRTEQYALLKEVFCGAKEIHLMKNVEAELAKYMHNGNGTVKVHFNNLIHQLAKHMGADYSRVRFGACLSGYVDMNHTDVPGPDGLLGYGGKCFPKDMDALIGLMVRAGIRCNSLMEMQSENRIQRSGRAP